MKKLTKILVIVLSVALLCGAFLIGASAAAPAATTTEAFEVTDSNGASVGKYVTLGEAFTNVPDGGKITVLKNAEQGPTLAGGTLDAGKNVTLDLNGKTIAASYATNGDSISYQKYYISGSLTVVGKGTIKAGTSAFVVANGASLTFDAGEGKTINLVATKSYDMSGTASSNTFPGLQFVKIGSNASYNTNLPTVTVKGNLNFTNESGKESAALFGLFSGARLNISDADITATTPNAASSFITNYTMNSSTPYDADKYIGPEVTINNSNIEYPYGHFYMNHANGYTTDYSDAVSLTVTNSTLNLYGDDYPAPGANYSYGDIYVKDNSMNKIVMSGTKVITDSNFYRCDTQSDVVPNTTVELTDCDITIEIYQGAQTAGEYNYRRKFFTGVVTAIVDDTMLAHSFPEGKNGDSGRVLRYTHAWCDGATAKAAGRVDPGYFEKLGMGVLFKDGTTFTYKKGDALGTPVASGVHHSTFSGYALEKGCNLNAGSAVIYGVLTNLKIVGTGTATYNNVQYVSFTNAKVGTYNDGTNVSADGSYGSGVDTNGFKNRRGRYTVCEYGGNKYITHVAQEGTNSDPNILKDPSIALGFGNSATNGVYSAPINAYRFYSFEFDIAPAELRYSQGEFGPRFLFRGDAGTEYISVFCITDANGKTVWEISSSYAGAATAQKVATFEAAEVAANVGKWQHVQMIIEAPVADGAFDTKNAANFQIHLYLDGELAGSAALSKANSTLAGKLAKLTDFTRVGITEVRFRFPTGYHADDKGSTAFDNFTLSRYSIGYTGSAVNKRYTLPADLPLVEVEGEKYFDIEKAFEDLGFYAYDDYAPTLKYLVDISSIEFDPAEYAYDETSTYKFVTKGAAPKIKGGSGYVVDKVPDEENTYIVRPATADDMVTVTWIDAAGVTVHTDKVLKGAAVVAPVIEDAKEVKEKYYTAVYDSWLVGEDVVSAGSTVTASADMEIRVAASLTLTFNDLYVNVQLIDNLPLRFFVPEDFKPNCTIKVGGSAATNHADIVTIGDATYASFVKYGSGFAAFADTKTIVVEYKVVHDGKEYTLSRSFESLSPLSYAEYILSAVDEEEKFVYSELEREHIANLVRHANDYIKVNSGNYNANVKALYEEYADICSEYKADLLNATNKAELDALSPYIKDIGFELVKGRVRYVLTFEDNTKVTGVKIMVAGGEGGLLNTYATDNEKNGNYYTLYRTASNRLFSENFFTLLKIELTVEGLEAPVVGYYDINTWFNAQSEADKEKWSPLLNSLYCLGETLHKYWYEDISEQ